MASRFGENFQPSNRKEGAGAIMGARDSKKLVEVGKENGISKLLARLPLNFLRSHQTETEPSQPRSESKFPHLHRQPHCIVDEPRRCPRANNRPISVASACACQCTSTNPVDVVGCSIDRADVDCAQMCRYCESSAHRVATVCCASPNDGAACCRWYDCVYGVTSYRADPGDPLMYTTRWGDNPVIRPTTLQLSLDKFFYCCLFVGGLCWKRKLINKLFIGTLRVARPQTSPQIFFPLLIAFLWRAFLRAMPKLLRILTQQCCERCSRDIVLIGCAGIFQTWR